MVGSLIVNFWFRAQDGKGDSFNPGGQICTEITPRGLFLERGCGAGTSSLASVPKSLFAGNRKTTFPPVPNSLHTLKSLYLSTHVTEGLASGFWME